MIIITKINQKEIKKIFTISFLIFTIYLHIDIYHKHIYHILNRNNFKIIPIYFHVIIYGKYLFDYLW